MPQSEPFVIRRDHDRKRHLALTSKSTSSQGARQHRSEPALLGGRSALLACYAFRLGPRKRAIRHRAGRSSPNDPRTACGCIKRQRGLPPQEIADEAARRLPSSIKPPRDLSRDASENDRVLSRVRVGDEEPLCRARRGEDQVYRFTWNGSFDRNGVVRWSFGRSSRRSRRNIRESVRLIRT